MFRHRDDDGRRAVAEVAADLDATTVVDAGDEPPPTNLRVGDDVTLGVEREDAADGRQADACITVQRGLACTIMVADCLPVLLATEDGAVVAAAHAGWRGLAGVDEPGGQGVLESVYQHLKAAILENTEDDATKIVAWLGPCIGPSAFEVGPEVKAAFEAGQPGTDRFFVPGGAGKYLADLPALARLRLQALGVTQIYGNDGSLPWCTVSNPSRFFSHRRDAGVGGNGFGTTGRMAACIWME